ncbi:MAG: ribonuclease P protein component [Bacteroides sp.]|nr:ribonuclease P protein component [Bacteroides sp.]
MPRRFTLPKSTKLCSATAVDRLFAREATAGTVAYPLRAVWRPAPERTNGDQVQFMITIPKKRLRHAVDRVTMRRRVREAYRLSRHDHTERLEPDQRLDIAFIYLADKLLPYASIAKAMNRILSTAIPPCTREQ